MSDGYALALQKGIRTALLADAGVSALISARLYDEPPGDVTYPYARFGSIVTDTGDTDGSLTANVSLMVEAYSRATGRVEASRIVEAVRAALHRQEASVSATGFGVVELVCNDYFVERDDAAGRGYMGRALFSAILETSAP